MAVAQMTVKQEINKLQTDLKLNAAEIAAATSTAQEIARRYRLGTMGTPVFRSQGGAVFNPEFVSKYSGYVLPRQVKPDKVTEDLDTELVCKNVILSLLGDNHELILLFILKILETCSRRVSAGYAVYSLGQALCGNPDYDAIFQVRLAAFDVDDDESGDPTYRLEEDDDVPSSSTRSSSSSVTGASAVSIASSARSAFDSVAGRSLPIVYATLNPTVRTGIDHVLGENEQPEYLGVGISPQLSAEFLSSSRANIEQFCEFIGGMADGIQRVYALLRSIVGFLVVQIGESKHPQFERAPSVNLICSKTINGVTGSGQALMAIFLMASLENGADRACLELAGHITENLPGACLYTKWFKPDYERLLWTTHGGSHFYDPTNLPMSIEFLNGGQRMTLNDIRTKFTSRDKHPVCSVPIIRITVQFPKRAVGMALHQIIANAQREAAATMFMRDMVKTVKVCAQQMDRGWRDGLHFNDLMVSTVKSALKVYHTLIGDRDTPLDDRDTPCAYRSKCFSSELKEIVLSNPRSITVDNYFNNPLFDTNCLKPKDSIVIGLLDTLDNDLTAYLQTITDVAAAAAAAAAARAAPPVALAAVAPVAPIAPVPDQVLLRTRAARALHRNDLRSAMAQLVRPSLSSPDLSSLLTPIPESNAQQLESDHFDDDSVSSTASLGRTPSAVLGTLVPDPLHRPQIMSAQQHAQDDDTTPSTFSWLSDASSFVNAQPKKRSLSRDSSTTKYQTTSSEGGKKQTKNKRNKNKPKTKRRAANKKNKKVHAGRVSRHNKVFRRKTRKSK